MKLKKSTIALSFCCFIIFLLYIFLASQPLASELQLTPAWTINVQQPVAQKNPDDILLPFKLGQIYGYFTQDGKIITSMTYPYKATISPYYYTQYAGTATDIPFYKQDGTQAGIIKISGFPFFYDNKIYQFLPGGTSFVQCNEDGSEKWRYEGVFPITAFTSSKAGCAVGFADGTVIAFSNDGEALQQFSPSGSEYPIILGAALSPDGQYTACISGQNKQRIVLAKREQEHSIISFFKYFSHDQPTQSLVKFSNDSSLLYYNSPSGLGIVECATGVDTEIPIEGKVISIQESEIDNTTYVLSRKNNQYSITILEASMNILGTFTYQAQSSFILTYGDSLFVGKDTQISRLELSKK